MFLKWLADPREGNMDCFQGIVVVWFDMPGGSLKGLAKGPTCLCFAHLGTFVGMEQLPGQHL